MTFKSEYLCLPPKNTLSEGKENKDEGHSFQAAHIKSAL